MTVNNPEPSVTNAIEPKVKWAGIGAYLSGVVALALVNALTGDENVLLIATLPDVVEPFVLPLVPTLVAMIAGWAARHQWRAAETKNPSV